MNELNLDAVLIEDSNNKRYISGFTGTAGSILITKNKCILFTDFRYTQQAKDQAINFEIVEISRTNPITNFLKKMKINRLGFEDDKMSFSTYSNYKEALNVLSGIKDRSARWYYYSSIANSGMGNNVLALEHAKEALRLEPSNYQYQSLVSRLENGGSWYRTQQTMYGGTPTINNDFCVKLCIANIMCNLCCGGGGFFCGSPYTYH